MHQCKRTDISAPDIYKNKDTKHFHTDGFSSVCALTYERKMRFFPLRLCQTLRVTIYRLTVHTLSAAHNTQATYLIANNQISLNFFLSWLKSTPERHTAAVLLIYESQRKPEIGLRTNGTVFKHKNPLNHMSLCTPTLFSVHFLPLSYYSGIKKNGTKTIFLSKSQF